MFKIVLLALAASLGLQPILACPPDLHGLATYYGPPAFYENKGMRNGEPLRLSGATVAVDASHWPHWANARAIVFVPG